MAGIVDSVFFLFLSGEEIKGSALFPRVGLTFTHPFDTKSFLDVADPIVYAMPGAELYLEIAKTGDDAFQCFSKAFTWGAPARVPGLKGIPRAGKLVAVDGVKEFELIRKGT
jgi:hypothetical protein